MKLGCGTSCQVCPKCWRLNFITVSSHLVTGRPRIRFGTYSQLGSSISHGFQNAARLGHDVVGNVFKRATNLHCVSASRTLQNFIPHWIIAFSTFMDIWRKSHSTVLPESVPNQPFFAALSCGQRLIPQYLMLAMAILPTRKVEMDLPPNQRASIVI